MSVEGAIDRHWSYTATTASGTRMVARGSDRERIVTVLIEQRGQGAACISLTREDFEEWAALVLDSTQVAARARESDPDLYTSAFEPGVVAPALVTGTL